MRPQLRAVDSDLPPKLANERDIHPRSWLECVRRFGLDVHHVIHEYRAQNFCWKPSNWDRRVVPPPLFLIFGSDRLDGHGHLGNDREKSLHNIMDMSREDVR